MRTMESASAHYLLIANPMIRTRTCVYACHRHEGVAWRNALRERTQRYDESWNGSLVPPPFLLLRWDTTRDLPLLSSFSFSLFHFSHTDSFILLILYEVLCGIVHSLPPFRLVFLSLSLVYWSPVQPLSLSLSLVLSPFISFCLVLSG